MSRDVSDDDMAPLFGFVANAETVVLLLLGAVREITEAADSRPAL